MTPSLAQPRTHRVDGASGTESREISGVEAPVCLQSLEGP